MGDTLELFRPLCNGSVRVESRTEKLTGDAGFLLLREALDRTALIEPLAAQLEDPRDPRRITHSLPSLMRASVAIIAQGWCDQSDAARLHDDPVLAIAVNDRAGVGAAEDALASQATFSRLLDLLSREQNREVLETAPLELAARRRRAQGHQRLERVTIDIDGLPLPVHGEQAGSAYNGHVRERMHYPLIASCAETGDLLAGLLRDGNAVPGRITVVIERRAADLWRRLLLRWKHRPPLPTWQEAPRVAGADRLRTGIALARMTAESRLHAEMQLLSGGKLSAERPQPSSLRSPQVFGKQVVTENAQKKPREARS